MIANQIFLVGRRGGKSASMVEELLAEINVRDQRILRLENALRAMLAVDDDAPEYFPGQNAAYLLTVAIPRAQKALSGEPE